MTTVLITTCNKEIRENIKGFLDINRDLYPITCSCKIEKVEEIVELIAPQFIIIDLIQDYKSGLNLVELVSRKYSDLKIIVVTVSNDQNIMIEAFRCGVDGYLVKNSLFNELNRCVCNLLQGDKYVCNEIVNKVLNYYITTPDKELEKSFFLSEKEQELIKHIGLNPKEIAHIMKISKKTVDNSRNRIMKKLNLNSIVDIVKYAIREQMIKL
jgi:DNA-binding NarL/FixJ family response regulator